MGRLAFSLVVFRLSWHWNHLDGELNHRLLGSTPEFVLSRSGVEPANVHFYHVSCESHLGEESQPPGRAL